MLKKIILGGLAVLVVFLIYVSTREGHFNYEKNGVINAPADKIFPYLSNFKLGAQWNPYDQKDPAVKRTFTGSDGQVGSVMEFEGNKDAGSGKLEILNIVPNSGVEIRLTMTKPFHAENIIHYTLSPEGAGTRFSWAMSGDGGFMGKLVSVFMDCEKMIAGDFNKGIANLKTLVEAQNK
jgi:uncharacterized protein YndB with AHSA1/START domain